jgi:hypothetical protein
MESGFIRLTCLQIKKREIYWKGATYGYYVRGVYTWHVKACKPVRVSADSVDALIAYGIG